MKLRLIILAAVLFVSPAVTRAQKVTVDYDKSVNFSGFKTFTWSEGSGQARNPIVGQMIKDAVERELNARGLTRVETNPDLRFSVMAASGMDLQVEKPGWDSEAGVVLNSGVYARGVMWDVSTGTLLLDAFDNKTDQMVWRAFAKDTLPQAPGPNPVDDAKKVEKVVKKAISKMFKKFPAGVAQRP
jgi:hypothetical protein